MDNLIAQIDQIFQTEGFDWLADFDDNDEASASLSGKLMFQGMVVGYLHCRKGKKPLKSIAGVAEFSRRKGLKILYDVFHLSFITP